MSTYKWRNRLLLDLPFRMAQHDPVGGQSLNVGRAGADLNAVFGAGAAEPTKLGYRRGYGFDGGDQLECSAGYAISTGLLSLMVFVNGPPAATGAHAFSWQTVGGDTITRIITTATTIRFYCGSVAAGTFASDTRASHAVAPGQPYTIVGTYDGVNTSLYINTLLADEAAAPTAPPATAQPMWVGARTDAGSYWTGEIYHVGMADFALTPTQVKQYHREMFKRLHQI